MITAIFIDDEALTRKQISDIFSWIDPDIQLLGTFSNSTSAINFLRTQKVDIIFTDIFLKTSSGLDIAKYVYENKIVTKVILVSAYESFVHAKQGYKYSVYAYINKPFDISELKQLLLQIKRELPFTPAPVNDAFIISSSLDATLDTYKNRDKNLIDIALKYINDNFNQDISLSTVSGYLGLNSSYFSRLFKMTMGINFSDYLISLRISKAEALLKESQTPIDIIARSVGYHHIALFYSTFKKLTGLTPSEYRKTNGAQT